MRISIIGAGSFGTAMAVAAARAGNEVVLWAHDPNVVATIRETGANPDYLAGMRLSDRIHATNDLEEAATFCDTMFMVVPSHHYREVLTNLRGHLRGRAKVISGTKGIENESQERMSEVTAHVLGEQLAAFRGAVRPDLRAGDGARRSHGRGDRIEGRGVRAGSAAGDVVRDLPSVQQRRHRRRGAGRLAEKRHRHRCRGSWKGWVSARTRPPR